MRLTHGRTTLAALLTLLASGCAGGGAGLPGMAVQPGSAVLDAAEAAGSVRGVTAGGFTVLRYNADGRTDAALNSTLHLRVAQAPDGGGASGGCAAQNVTALTIDVADGAYSTSVALDLRYDAARLHPLRVEYAGLLGDDAQVLSAAFLDRPGLASLGQCAIGDWRSPALSGRFATLYFAAGAAARTASAVGDVHANPAGVDCEIENLANFAECEVDTVEQTLSLTWYGGWHYGDGDQNGEVNIADMTPIGLYFGESTADDWAAVRADYDHNTEVNIADLTQIGLYFGEGTTSYAIEGSDNVDGATRTFITSVGWDDGEPFNSAAAVAGALYPAFSSWRYTISPTSPVTLVQLWELDENGDGAFRLHLTPREDVGTPSYGVSSYRDITPPPYVPDTMTITSFDIQVAGATGGLGPNADLFSEPDAPQLVVVANQQITLSLNAIGGTYDALPFDGHDLGGLPASLTPADYDEALALARAQLHWAVSNAGAADFRYTGDWLTSAAGHIDGSGDPGLCTVFPDDDPQSDSSLPEGSLTVSLPAMNDWIADESKRVLSYVEIQYTITADVTADAAVPVVLGCFDEALAPLAELYLPDDTPVKLAVSVPGVAPEHSAYSGYVLELRNVLGADASSAPIVFTYSDTFPLAAGQFGVSDPPEPGQPMPTSGFYLDCVVPGLQLVPGMTGAFRLNAGAGLSSVNKPDALLYVVAPAG